LEGDEMAQIKHGRLVTASGQSLSSGLKLVTETLVGIYTPAVLTAAALRIQASEDGQTYVDVVDAGSPIRVTAAANQYLPLDATKLLGAAYVRVRHEDSGGSPVVEAAERVLRPVFRTFE
jgi:hypothetical protein